MAPSGWCSAQGRRLGWPAQDRTLPATRRSLGPHEVLILERGALEVDDPLGPQWDLQDPANLDQGWGSLVGCCLWGRTELDMTEAT